jgi:hypothetical protein
MYPNSPTATHIVVDAHDTASIASPNWPTYCTFHGVGRLNWFRIGSG